ncbi:hypothetical protein DYI95_002985 [Thermaerobacter sp. PB12/4term]|uniref:polysaccharide pyruvyl transferase family protein n=1 Tax=Thermaerobacter sp. PB12/4term TaxID=2293838 RepID=UPI000E327E3B|nr:polysaccharide pyruvyl transferase family protein [Thermaerobacter sp. PB12/4term]QIA26631.1 hypothetical protein DYI95_002985 [Thermaerobacter sp. PB12/4term]
MNRPEGLPGSQNRWFFDPINLVEAAVVLVAAAGFWAVVSGSGPLPAVVPPGAAVPAAAATPVGPAAPAPAAPRAGALGWAGLGWGLGGWIVYALLRRWRPAAPRSPEEPVPAPASWLLPAATLVMALALVQAVVLAVAGILSLPLSSLLLQALYPLYPLPSLAPAGSATGMAAPGDGPGAGLSLTWGMAWPIAGAAVTALFQMVRRDARLRRPAGRLLAATVLLLVATALMAQLPAVGWAGWLGPLSLLALLGYQVVLARLSAYVAARWRLEPGAVHPRGAQGPPPPAMRPPVVLSGFFGAGNAGDEAILAAVLHQLRQRGYQDITVFSTRPAETARTHGVKAVYRGWRRDILAKARALARAGIFISGGGGLLQDTSRTFLLRGPVPYYLMISTWARVAGCWVLFLGHGVGPLRGRWARFLTRWLASQADVITTRDEGSLQLLDRLGVRRPVRELLADFVFSLPRPAPAEAGEPSPAGPHPAIPAPDPGRRWLAVSVRSWPGQDRFFPELAAFLRHVLATRPDVEVVLVPMEGEPDHRAAEELAALIGSVPLSPGPRTQAFPAPRAPGSPPPAPQTPGVPTPARQTPGDPVARVRILPADLSPSQLEAAVAQAWVAVGMRLHFLIFAARAGVPVLALNYDPKVAGVLARLGLGESVYDLETVTAEGLQAGLDAIEARYDGIRRNLEEAMGRMAALASAHLDYADAAARRWSGEA